MTDLANNNYSYKELQGMVKEMKAQGLTETKLNASKETLYSVVCEYVCYNSAPQEETHEEKYSYLAIDEETEAPTIEYKDVVVNESADVLLGKHIEFSSNYKYKQSVFKVVRVECYIGRDCYVVTNEYGTNYWEVETLHKLVSEGLVTVLK